MNLKFQGYFCYWLTVFYFFLITFLLLAPFFMSENVVFFALVLSAVFFLFSSNVSVLVENQKGSIFRSTSNFIVSATFTTFYPLFFFFYWGAPYLIKLSLLFIVVLSIFSIGIIWNRYDSKSD